MRCRKHLCAVHRKDLSNAIAKVKQQCHWHKVENMDQMKRIKFNSSMHGKAVNSSIYWKWTENGLYSDLNAVLVHIMWLRTIQRLHDETYVVLMSRKVRTKEKENNLWNQSVYCLFPSLCLCLYDFKWSVDIQMKRTEQKTEWKKKNSQLLKVYTINLKLIKKEEEGIELSEPAR